MSHCCFRVLLSWRDIADLLQCSTSVLISFRSSIAGTASTGILKSALSRELKQFLIPVFSKCPAQVTRVWSGLFRNVNAFFKLEAPSVTKMTCLSSDSSSCKSDSLRNKKARTTSAVFRSVVSHSEQSSSSSRSSKPSK